MVGSGSAVPNDLDAPITSAHHNPGQNFPPAALHVPCHHLKHRDRTELNRNRETKEVLTKF